MMDEYCEDGQVGRHVGRIDSGRLWLNAHSSVRLSDDGW